MLPSYNLLILLSCKKRKGLYGVGMSRGEEIAKFLIEQGNEWTATELSKEFGCTPNSVTTSMTAVRRYCTLVEVKRPSNNSVDAMHYRAQIDRGVGLLAMNKPIHKHQPSRVHTVMGKNND